MNRKQLDRLHGKPVRIRPIPKRFDHQLGWLTPIEDYWDIQAPEPRVRPPRATNQATGHFIDLTSDNVYEFRNPDLLILKTQITLTGRGLFSDPLPDPRARHAAPKLQVKSVGSRAVSRTPPRPASSLGALACLVLIGLAVSSEKKR
jgi:hypothetical protein